LEILTLKKDSKVLYIDRFGKKKPKNRLGTKSLLTILPNPEKEFVVHSPLYLGKIVRVVSKSSSFRENRDKAQIVKVIRDFVLRKREELYKVLFSNKRVCKVKKAKDVRLSFFITGSEGSPKVGKDNKGLIPLLKESLSAFSKVVHLLQEKAIEEKLHSLSVSGTGLQKFLYFSKGSGKGIREVFGLSTQKAKNSTGVKRTQIGPLRRPSRHEMLYSELQSSNIKPQEKKGGYLLSSLTLGKITHDTKEVLGESFVDRFGSGRNALESFAKVGDFSHYPKSLLQILGSQKGVKGLWLKKTPL
jgi:hypothetical protein